MPNCQCHRATRLTALVITHYQACLDFNYIVLSMQVRMTHSALQRPLDVSRLFTAVSVLNNMTHSERDIYQHIEKAYAIFP